MGRERRKHGDLVQQPRLRERQRRTEVALVEEPDALREQAVEAPHAGDGVVHG